eukprot:GGOE01030547.1.p1 GENE.GGOE01030547.1~~GGOE01030547.1.p1  ORF type:complete len:1082 (+),score=326.97 GGOE01030547.1:463-3246(+)
MDANGRQQLNNVSSFLDGSPIYGTDSIRAAALRTFVGGALKNNSAGEAPLNSAGLQQVNPLRRNLTELRMTGDPRGNISPQVLAYISLFIREHNRYCGVLQANNPTWSDEVLYQEARRRVIAHIQRITIVEYVPVLLGSPLVLYAGYNPSVNPTIENFFAAAGLQYTVAEWSGIVLRLTKDYVASPNGNMLLRQAVYNPAMSLQEGVEPVLRGMSFNLQDRAENNAEDDVRNHWLEDPGISKPTDLFALTIQRARDHGLPSYTEMCQLFSLPAVAWKNVTADATLAKAFQQLYPTISGLDALIGALGETVSRGAVGNLMRASITEQFLRLRSGDRFWYENNQFNDTELQSIESTPLSHIINRNTAINWPYPLYFFRHDAQADGGLFQDPLMESAALSSQYTHSKQLGANFWIYWSVDYTQQTISFAANARCGGWMGMGFTASEGRAVGSYMSAVDMTVGQVVSGVAVVEDYYSFEMGLPSLDTALGCTSDVLNGSLVVTSDSRILRFTRRFATMDSAVARGRLMTGADAVKKSQIVKCDEEFFQGQEYAIVWAYHPTSDPWLYHAAYRGVSRDIIVPYPKPTGGTTGTATSPQSDNSPVVGIAIGVSAGVLAVAAGIGVAILWWQKRKSIRAAPRTLPFCLMFTDIEQSTQLWSTDPVVMGGLIELHNVIIRRVIVRYKAYEVKTIGDSFMIAAKDPLTAVRIAVDIQLDLYHQQWSANILDLLRKVFPDDPSSPVARRQTLFRSPWNGPRVRIGIHYATADARVAVELDRTSGRYDYYGPPVNAAARVESSAKGGQIIASSDVVEACLGLGADENVIVEDLGEIRVKGINHPIAVFQIAPIQLADRVFPDLDPMSPRQSPTSATAPSHVTFTLKESPTATGQRDLPGMLNMPRVHSSSSASDSHGEEIKSPTSNTRLMPILELEDI